MNIIYIHSHDTGRIIAPYGYAVPTPNLMSFCQDATLFRQAFSVAPTCSPSRAGLLTGLYPHTNGMVGLSSFGFSLKDYSQHLVQFLNRNNYRTILCGIQHEAYDEKKSNKAKNIIGYDEDISIDPLLFVKGKDGTIYTENHYLWDLENSTRVVNWLKENKDKKAPFLLTFGCFSTHREYPTHIKDDINPNYVQVPYPAQDTPEVRKDFAQYMTSVSYLDTAFGCVIKGLKDTGLYDNSIIIYTTDHGIANPFCKSSLYDTGIGVSLAIRVPNSNSKGDVIDEMVSQVDIFPTLCDLLKLEKPQNLQGKSFATVFENPSCSLREEIFAEYNYHTSYEPIRCVRTKRYKYIKYFDKDYTHINFSNIDDCPEKDLLLKEGLQYVIKDSEYLFDLMYDKGERNNLIKEENYQKVLEDMRKRLEKHMKDTDDPLLVGPISHESFCKIYKKECISNWSKDPEDYICNFW